MGFPTGFVFDSRRQALTLQYNSTFANDVLYPASKNISRFVRSNSSRDYFTNNAIAWNPLRPRISLTKTAGGQQTPSAEQCRTMGVAEGHCGLASWNVSVRNAGDGQLPSGWVMQDTGSGVWYTKQLLQDSLRVTVDGKQLAGATQVSSDNGKTWIDLNKAQESQRYTSFRFVADNALAPDTTAAITYQSLFDSSETTVRKNSALRELASAERSSNPSPPVCKSPLWLKTVAAIRSTDRGNPNSPPARPTVPTTHVPPPPIRCP